MNQKKESILRSNIYNFLDALELLDNAYKHNNEIQIYKFSCVLERQATRLYTHYEDWTTINDDLKYLDVIKKSINNRLVDVTLHENLKAFIKEQQDIDGMMYYTFILLSYAKLI